MRQLAVAALLLAWMGCHAPVRRAPAAPVLLGLTLPLAPALGPGLTLEGRCQGAPAVVALELARALSTATAACFGSRPPQPRAQVRVPLAAGGFETAPALTLEGLVLGGRALAPFTVALADGPGGCRVTLGVDVLSPYAVAGDVPGGTVRLLAPGTPEGYALWASSAPAFEERALAELSRGPTSDLPLVAVGLREGGRHWVAPLLLSTTLARSAIASASVGAPGDRWTPAALELAPGFEVAPPAFAAVGTWRSQTADGLLGMDVLGSTRFVVDMAAHTLALARDAPVRGRPAGAAGR